MPHSSPIRASIIVILCAALLGAVTASAGTNPADNPKEPSIRPVSVLFSAVDQAGSPIRDLAKDQITVMDNNATASVADVRSVGDAPLSLGIVLLASQTNFKKEQEAAIALVQKLMRSDKDRAFVITAGGTKHWSQNNLDWESDPEALKKEIGALDKSAGIPDAFNYDLSTYSGDTTTSAARWHIESQKGGGTSFFDAVWGMMMADKRPARRVLVMFRNPWVHAPGMAKEYRDFSDKKHAEIIANAQKLHVTIFAVGVEEPSPSSTQAVTELQNNYGKNGIGDIMRENDRQTQLQKERLYNGGRANVERLANETGGETWWNGKYSDNVVSIANALSGQYLLTFMPAASTAGPHKLKVTCSGGTRVLAPEAFLLAAPAAAK